MAADEFAPLPRGRHSLPREQVEGVQRERLLRAMVECAAESGYAAVSVADVLARAGVSRATFYALFTSKEDCFMAAYEAATGFVLSPQMMATAAAEPSPRQALSYGIQQFLQRFVESPAVARIFMVEVYAVGPEAVRRRAATLRAQADTITRLLGRTDEADTFAGRAFVLASGALVSEVIMEQGVEHLPALHDPLLELGVRLLRLDGETSPPSGVPQPVTSNPEEISS